MKIKTSKTEKKTSMRFSLLFLSVLSFFVFVLLPLIAPLALAAEKYRVGEEVQVFFLGEWRPATVRDMDKKGTMLCEFEFAAAVQQRVFSPAEVRRPYEAGALTPGRQWSDATGKYKIKAVLLRISAGKAELRTEDMKEISIPIEKLSTNDQNFLKSFQKKAGLAALPIPKLPEVESFSNSKAVNIASKGRRWSSQEEANTDTASLKLPPDPIRKGLELTQKGVGFPALTRHEKVSSLLALGGSDNWLLASIGESEEQPTRLMWASLTKQSIKRIQMLPAGEMLIDYHAASRQLLTYSKRRGAGAFDSQPVLTIWRAEPDIEEAQAVVSWNATIPDDKSWHNSVPWVRFASDSIVLQRTETHRILAWDTKSRSLAWQTAQESFFAPEPRLSAGGKYLLLPEDGGLRICDSLSGNLLGQLPMDGCAGVAAHPGGSLIAVLNRTSLFIVDISGKQPTMKLAASGVGSPFSANFDWVGSELLAFDSAGGIVLFSLKHELPIWNYKFDASAFWGLASNGARKRSIVDDHLVYAATFNEGGREGLAVGAVLLPSGKASAAMSAAKREDLLLIKRGAKFRVDVTAIDHASEIRQALLKEIQANGWVYDANALNAIKAEYKRGEPREIRYELQSIVGGGRQVQSATITPYVASVKVMVGDDEAWSNISSSGPPPVVSMREGDSLQSEIDRSNQPTWSFYQTVDIPTEIVDPKKRGGLGSTAVSNRGLVEGTDLSDPTK